MTANLTAKYRKWERKEIDDGSSLQPHPHIHESFLMKLKVDQSKQKIEALKHRRIVNKGLRRQLRSLRYHLPLDNAVPVSAEVLLKTAVKLLRRLALGKEADYSRLPKSPNAASGENPCSTYSKIIKAHVKENIERVPDGRYNYELLSNWLTEYVKELRSAGDALSAEISSVEQYGRTLHQFRQQRHIIATSNCTGLITEEAFGNLTLLDSP